MPFTIHCTCELPPPDGVHDSSCKIARVKAYAHDFKRSDEFEQSRAYYYIGAPRVIVSACTVLTSDQCRMCQNTRESDSSFCNNPKCLDRAVQTESHMSQGDIALAITRRNELNLRLQQLPRRPSAPPRDTITIYATKCVVCTTLTAAHHNQRKDPPYMAYTERICKWCCEWIDNEIHQNTPMGVEFAGLLR